MTKNLNMSDKNIKLFIPPDVNSRLINNKEWEVVKNIRKLGHGRVIIYIQDGMIIEKEITEKMKIKKGT